MCAKRVVDIVASRVSCFSLWHFGRRGRPRGRGFRLAICLPRMIAAHFMESGNPSWRIGIPRRIGVLARESGLLQVPAAAGRRRTRPPHRLPF